MFKPLKLLYYFCLFVRDGVVLLFQSFMHKIKGKLTDKHIKVLKKLKAESILDEKNEIRYTEVMNTLKKILDVETSGLIEEMFDSMLRQGVKTNIVNHLKTNMLFDQL